jgi:hypothetical protein
MDLMISFQLGLPSNICLENSDTKAPNHLTDADFDEDTAVLPPSRPETEHTRLLWFIVKDRMMPGFNKVCRDALSFREKTQEEILQLDHEIQRMHETIPEVLRTRPMSESWADPPFAVLTRLYVEFIYLKSLLVLHRRYIARGHVHSIQTCVQAGKQLVSQIIGMLNEFAPGGQLHSQRSMLTNFTVNDFCMGIMTLLLVVHLRRKTLLRGHHFPVDAATETELLGLLEQAYRICREKSNQSRDAARVARAIRVVVDRYATSNLTAIDTVTTSNRDSSVWSYPSQSDSTFLLLDQDFTFDQLDPFAFMGNDFDGIDWTVFNAQVQQGA